MFMYAGGMGMVAYINTISLTSHPIPIASCEKVNCPRAYHNNVVLCAY